MNILDTLKQLRDDIKTWVINNLNALNTKIDEKTVPIDSELSSTSTNPVQNKVIKKAIDNIPKFSGDYNDLTNAPNISEDDSGNMIIADESGNIIFKADADGIHTTAVSINGETAATETYVDNAVANIDIPEVDFTGYATEDFVTNSVESAKTEISESIVAESEEWKVVDEVGNIIFSVDAEGAHTTNLTLNGESVADIVNDKFASLVDSAPDTLNTLNKLAQALGDDPNFASTVATEIGKKVDKVDGKGLSTNDFTNEYKEKLDGLENITFEESDPTVPAWAKEATKPSYTAAEVGALPDTTPLFSGDYNDLDNAPDITEDSAGDLIIADKSGNIIFKVDANGVHTTAATINDEAIATQEWVNGVIAGKVDYLGTVSSFYEMTSSAPNLQPNPGDYWRANAEFTHIETNEIIHSGDLLIYTGGDNFVDVIHTEDPGNYVTLNTEQNISAKKTFKNFKENNALEIFYSENLNRGPIATINSQQFRITTPVGKFNEIGIDGLAASTPGGSVTTLYSFDGIRPYQGGVLEFPSDIVDTEKIATQEWVNAQNFGSGNVDTSDFVSKSATSQQTLQSGLSFQNGGVINIFGFNDTPVIFDRERIRYISSDGSSELNYFFNPESGGVNTIATRGYVDEKIAELRTELKAYIDEAILGGKW